MKLKTIVSIMCASVMFSCTDLDMSPVNVVNEEDLFANEAGTLSYISGMYMNLPLEDFRYAYEGNPPFNYAWTIYAQPSCRTGEAIGFWTLRFDASNAVSMTLKRSATIPKTSAL